LQIQHGFAGACDLSVVIPVYNEEAGLDALVARVTASAEAIFADRYELVLVNDGSRDGSWAKICAHAERDPRIVAIDLARNHGHQLALTAGLNHARGELVFVLDADLQDPPELLGPMLEKVRQGYDVVYGQRIKRHGETAFKRGTAALFYRLLDRMVDTAIPRDTGDFRLMTRRVVDQLNAMPERYRFIRGLVSYVGFNQIAFPYERDPRFAGETNYPLRKMVALAVDAVTSFSTVPLRFASHLGMLFGLAGLASLFGIVAVWLQGGTVQGWASLAALILIMGSVQLLVLGVFGEYLGRMYMEAKRRPLFIVAEVRRQPLAGTMRPASEEPAAADTDLDEGIRVAG
jgi:dolichol-phosphate mannosyltransferase